MRVLLFGKTGQLGWELERALLPLGPLTAYGPDEFDLTDLDTLRRVILENRPQVIVNASAYTAVDLAEKESDLARRINVLAPEGMAVVARELDAALVHYSTDYVFDGKKNAPYTEQDIPQPLNTYGQTKLEGEQAIAESGAAYFIFRTSWVYGNSPASFVNKVLEWGRQRETLKIVSDQMGSPTWARMLAQATVLALAQGARSPVSFIRARQGIYHLGGRGVVSRLELAQAILRLDPRSQEQIVHRVDAACTADFPPPAVRPLYTALDCGKFASTFRFSLPPWEQALTLALG